MKKNSVLCLLLLLSYNSIIKCQRKVSPCPSVFTYDLDGDSNDIWYGTIKLQSSVTLHSITLDVIFDRRAENFGAYRFNTAITSDYIDFRIENKNFKLDPGRTLVMNVYCQYRGTAPMLKQIRLNGQNVCVDLPIAAVQPIYNPANSNSHNSDYDVTTKRSTQPRENPNIYDASSGSRNVNKITTTQSTISWNNYGNVNENNENNFGHITSSTLRNFESNNNNQRGRTITTTQRSIFNNNNQGGQGSGQGNNQKRTNTDSIYFENSDTNSNSGNNNNNNNYPRPVTSRPNDQRYTTQNSFTLRPSNINSQTTKKENYFPGDLPFFNGNGASTTHSILNTDDDNQCGTVIPKTNSLIVHGLETYHGNFPWHSAIYFSEIGSLKYICGGSLISMSMVLTAAHCVCHSKSKVAVSSDKFLVYLGKQNLQKWTGQEQDGKVVDVVVNSEYDPERFYSDIALLKLKESLRRSNYVRPVCLWAFDSDLKGIVDKVGNVPGWGYNENGLVSDDLTYVQMPVVTHETCIWSNRDFFSKVTSEKSFCAGFRNGTTVCNGDSGGGLVFKKNNKFYIRGVVSVSIALQNSLRCDPDHFAVFVDVAKYTSWINQFL